MQCLNVIKERADFELDLFNWKEIFNRPKDCFTCITPQVYVVIRLVVCLIWLAATIWSIVDWVVAGNSFGYWLTKLTHLSALWELLYFAFAAFSTCMAVYGSVPDGKRDDTPWFVSVTWFLSSGVLVLSFLVFFLYWVLLYDPADGAPAVLSVVTHGVNFVLALLDFAYGRRPLNIAHIWVPFTFAVLYGLFTYIYFIAGGTSEDGVSPYIYSVIDWSGDAEGTRSLLGLIILIVVPFLYTVFSCVYFCCRPFAQLAEVAEEAQDVEGANKIIGAQTQDEK